MNYEILQGDCLQTLATLPANSVQCCVTSPPYYGLRAYLDSDDPAKHLEIGTEPTPEQFVARLVEVFREVRRVLRDDGVVWLNLGDSYNTQPAGNKTPSGFQQNGSGGQAGALAQYGNGSVRRKLESLKPKDLIGIPWLVAFALRADGWYLRSEIIWHKRAPMPESVTDRPTKAHEQLFLLAKSPHYYYDNVAIAEPLETPIHKPGNNFHAAKVAGPNDRNGHSQWDDTKERAWGNEAGRNKRSVWTLGPESYSGAHFATMPTKLVEPCILAGTSAYGCCAKCGAPWARVVETGPSNNKHLSTMPSANIRGVSPTSCLNHSGEYKPRDRKELGWQPTCTCGCLDVVPCLVLDPFSGASTTGLVALKFGRKYIGCELNADYIAMSHKRLLGVASQRTLFELSAAMQARGEGGA